MVLDPLQYVNFYKYKIIAILFSKWLLLSFPFRSFGTFSFGLIISKIIIALVLPIENSN